jgi:hypothetical protein
MRTYTQQLKAAVKAARHQDPRIVGHAQVEGTDFYVTVFSVHIRPTGGACRAFAHWYKLSSGPSTDYQALVGDMDRADSFVQAANDWLKRRDALGCRLVKEVQSENDRP